jgi:hypothetical protein
MKNAGSSTPGDLYRARFANDFDNIVSRPVEHPEVISKCFQRLNAINKHNQARQLELPLVKYWQTQSACFRLVTTIIGIYVTDACKGYRYAFCLQKSDDEMTVHEFADC